MTQGGGERQQAGSTTPGGQRGLQARWVGREWDGDSVAMGKVLSLELLLLKHRQRYKLIPDEGLEDEGLNTLHTLVAGQPGQCVHMNLKLSTT